MLQYNQLMLLQIFNAFDFRIDAQIDDVEKVIAKYELRLDEIERSMRHCDDFDRR